MASPKTAFNPAEWFNQKGMSTAAAYGITRDTYGTWPLVHTNYSQMLAFNHVSFFFRWDGLFDSNRILKVLGMFLLGYYVGRNELYARLAAQKTSLKRIRNFGLLLGLPRKPCYAYVEMNPPGDGPAGLLHPLTYALSVVPMSIAYTATICLWFLKPRGSKTLLVFAAPGRMALTNYLMQSFIGVMLFYGVGFGRGAYLSLSAVLMIAILVYIFQIITALYG